MSTFECADELSDLIVTALGSSLEFRNLSTGLGIAAEGATGAELGAAAPAVEVADEEVLPSRRDTTACVSDGSVS